MLPSHEGFKGATIWFILGLEDGKKSISHDCTQSPQLALMLNHSLIRLVTVTLNPVAARCRIHIRTWMQRAAKMRQLFPHYVHSNGQPQPCLCVFCDETFNVPVHCAVSIE